MIAAQSTTFQRTKVYGNGCTQLAKVIRDRLRLVDGSTLKIWVRIRRNGRLIGESLLDAAVTSGGEIYVGGAGARAGDIVDVVLAPP